MRVSRGLPAAPGSARSRAPAGCPVRHRSATLRGAMEHPPAVSTREAPSARGLATAAALVPITMGLVVLVGWAFGIDTLKAQWSLGVKMKANTAVALFLSGISLLLLLPPACPAWRRRLGRVGGAIVCA